MRLILLNTKSQTSMMPNQTDAIVSRGELDQVKKSCITTDLVDSCRHKKSIIAKYYTGSVLFPPSSQSFLSFHLTVFSFPKHGMVHLTVFRNGMIYFHAHTPWYGNILLCTYSVVWFTVQSMLRIGKIFPCTHSVAWFILRAIFGIFIVFCF